MEVDLTTLDETWRGLGSPPVSHIKIDVEGAELDVLRGASECLRAERPVVRLEWNAQNLAACDVPPRSLLDFACSQGYKVLSLPHGVAVTGPPWNSICK